MHCLSGERHMAIAIRKQLLPLFVLLAFVVHGCGDSNEVTKPPETGSISIDTHPKFIGVPWALTGPAGFKCSSVGDTLLTNMTNGFYTIVWESISGWSPNMESESLTLETGESLVFRGEYAAAAHTITVTPSPRLVKWSLAWTFPDTSDLEVVLVDTVHFGVGLATLTDQRPEIEYTLSWLDTLGWDSPDPLVVTQRLSSGGSLLFSATYIQQVSVDIKPFPFSIDAPWRLAGPKGFREDGRGPAVLEFLTPGTYTITYFDADVAARWSKPAGETIEIEPGGTANFRGIYVFIGSPEPFPPQ